jgi:hypothetical protein
MSNSVNSPTNTKPSLGLFCELPGEVNEIAIIGGLLMAATDDGVYVISDDGKYEKVEPSWIT